MNCPKCGGDMWDNREKKTNPKAPDYKCKNASCGGAIWPPRDNSKPYTPVAKPTPQPHTCSIKQYVLNNACALTIKQMEGSIAEGGAWTIEDVHATLEANIKAIAGMMKGLDI